MITKKTRDDLRSARDVGKVVDALESLAGDLLDVLERAVPAALRGRSPAARLYVRTWRTLAESLLADWPDIPAGGRRLLDLEAIHAPTSVWVQAFGLGRGVGVDLVVALRRLSGGRPPALPRSMGALGELIVGFDQDRFLDNMHSALRGDRPDLDHVARVFHLSETELGRLFGVSRQRVGQWRDEGVPVVHRPKLNALARLAETLERNLVAERIPGVVRERADAFDGRSMLDLIADDQHQRVLDRVEESFDWSKTA